MMRPPHHPTTRTITERACYSCASSWHGRRQALRYLASTSILVTCPRQKACIHRGALARSSLPVIGYLPCYPAQQTIKTHTAR